MTSLNVAEWSPDQVADWLSGLGPTVARYIPGLRKQKLDGAKLLTLRCDDLEYLGMHVIGHQELLLEAVEHLRNFQYEARRECVQQLALRVSVVGGALARALRHQPDARLDTQALADVARTVHAVKPLVCWLDRWPALGAGLALAERKAALLKLSLEAATCAQRERFAEQPARAVAAAAASAAATADYIIQDVSDPMILQPASLDVVSLRQGERPLGFNVVPSFCGHHQLADIRFGSPAHASGLVHDGDEIVQVGGRCVIGWSGEAVVEACQTTARVSRGDLPLRLRRRAARPPPALATPRLQRLQRLRPAPARRVHVDLTIDRYESSLRRAAEARAEAAAELPRADSPASSSDDSEPLSPPASPTHLHLSHTRMYPPKPRVLVQRRHTVSCGSPVAKRPNLTIEQFWQQLREQRWERGAGSATVSPEPDDGALYRRDKALSCSTGLERSPRPRTCLPALPTRGPPAAPAPAAAAPLASSAGRGKLDKSHSTPAYDFGGPAADEPGPLVTQIIPESPTTPTDSPTILVHSAEKADQILDFKKSSSAIGEAILQQQSRRAVGGDERTEFPFGEAPPGTAAPPAEASDTQRVLETINIAMLEHRRRSVLDARLAEDRGDLAHIEQLKLVATRLNQRSASDRAPAPPPRPAATLRPAPGPLPTPAESTPSPVSPPCAAPVYPVLRAVPRPTLTPAADYSPFKLAKHIDTNQISLPLRHITKHDIKVIPSERRDLPAINSDPEPAPAAAVTPTSSPAAARDGDVLLSPAHTPSATSKSIFPSSKSRSLKKKSSMLAKRRMVPARALAGRGAAGGVWQRVRARGASTPRWARRHLLLTHNLLYAYRSPECARADCMIYLSGFTVSEASEVKSREHAFKVYHTGTAFYFACDSRDAMTTWISLLTRATLLPALRPDQMDVSKQFSETDYSETESDNESSEKRSEREREKEKDKDKSKFGSLKKLTVRMQRSESHENVGHTAASLDRKYLRFFSRHRKDDAKPGKSKQSGVPVPTEHYRSYRRVAGRPGTPPAAPPTAPATAPAAVPAIPSTERAKIPKPINYIHASNPNLLDFEKSDFVTKPTLQPPKPKTHKPENFIGFVTLEEFMLKKQEEERRQVYTNRVLMGVERDRDRKDSSGKKAAKELQKRLDRIVPDVIYGELPTAQSARGPPAGSPRPARDGKPISVRGADGYEKIVYPEELAAEVSAGGGAAGSHAPVPHAAHTPPPADRWRDSLRRNDKVHSAADSKNYGSSSPLPPPPTVDSWGGAVGAGGEPGSVAVSRLRLMFGGRPPPPAQCAPARAQYPHLQCPPTFQPETYSLARLAPKERDQDRDRGRDD